MGGWPTHLPGLLGPVLAAFAVTLLSGGGPATRWPSDPVVGGPAVGGPGVSAVVVLLVVVNGLGEETGWRGFLQPALQRHMRPLYATGVVAVIWAGWHAPLFAIVSNFRSFDAVTLVGFFIGLLSGAIVLGWLYNKTGSVLAVAVWHATYNLTSATEAAHGLPAAISTNVVIVAAIVLVTADLVTYGRVLAPTNRSEVLPRSGPSPRPFAAATQQAQEYRNSDRRLR